MNTKKVTKLPMCDACGSPAVYDAPTKTGQWANLCESDYITHSNSKLCTKFELVEPTPVVNSSRTVAGIEDHDIGYYESVIVDCAIREVTCPLCDHIRSIEDDALEFTCNCGATVLCREFLA